MRNFIWIFCALLVMSCSEQAKIGQISGWGDSMLKGAGGEKSVLEIISDELDIPHNNFAVGGLKSNSIGVLQGGIPLLVTVEDNKIRASGNTPIIYYNIGPLNFQGKQDRVGFLRENKGTFKRIQDSDDKKITSGYVFEAENLSENMAVNDTLRFYFEDAMQHKNDWTIIWAGRNDSKAGDAIFKTRDNIQAMLDYMGDDAREHCLILSVCNGIADKEGAGSSAYKNISRLNNLLRETFKEQFVDVRDYMVNQAIYDMDIELTEEDKSDMGKDAIPRRFLYDHVHFNTLGYEAAGKYLSKIIIERGWVVKNL